MIEIDQEAIKGKPINQYDENGKRTGVWVFSNWINEDCANYQKGKINGWRFQKMVYRFNKLYFYKKGNLIIEIFIDKKTTKLVKKTVTI